VHLCELVCNSVCDVSSSGGSAVRAENDTVSEVDGHDRRSEIDLATLEVIHVDVDAIWGVGQSSVWEACPNPRIPSPSMPVCWIILSKFSLPIEWFCLWSVARSNTMLDAACQRDMIRLSSSVYLKVECRFVGCTHARQAVADGVVRAEPWTPLRPPSMPEGSAEATTSMRFQAIANLEISV
jgi:hypothetical protein